MNTARKLSSSLITNCISFGDNQLVSFFVASRLIIYTTNLFREFTQIVFWLIGVRIIKFYRYFHTFPYKLKVKQKQLQKFYINFNGFIPISNYKKVFSSRNLIVLDTAFPWISSVFCKRQNQQLWLSTHWSGIKT